MSISQRIYEIYREMVASPLVQTGEATDENMVSFQELLNKACPTTAEEKAQRDLVRSMYYSNPLGFIEYVGNRRNRVSALVLWTESKRITMAFALVGRVHISWSEESNTYTVSKHIPRVNNVLSVDGNVDAPMQIPRRPQNHHQSQFQNHNDQNNIHPSRLQNFAQNRPQNYQQHFQQQNQQPCVWPNARQAAPVYATNVSQQFDIPPTSPRVCVPWTASEQNTLQPTNMLPQMGDLSVDQPVDQVIAQLSSFAHSTNFAQANNFTQGNRQPRLNSRQRLVDRLSGNNQNYNSNQNYNNAFGQDQQPRREKYVPPTQLRRYGGPPPAHIANAKADKHAAKKAERQARKEAKAKQKAEAVVKTPKAQRKPRVLFTDAEPVQTNPVTNTPTNTPTTLTTTEAHVITADVTPVKEEQIVQSNTIVVEFSSTLVDASVEQPVKKPAVKKTAVKPTAKTVTKQVAPKKVTVDKPAPVKWADEHDDEPSGN